MGRRTGSNWQATEELIAAEAQRPHAGLAIVVGIDQGEFGAIPRTLEGLFDERSDPGEWRAYTCFGSRGRGE